MTVCQIRRNNAEERIRAVLEGRKPSAVAVQAGEKGESAEPMDTAAQIDLEQPAIVDPHGASGTGRRGASPRFQEGCRQRQPRRDRSTIALPHTMKASLSISRLSVMPSARAIRRPSTIEGSRFTPD